MPCNSDGDILKSSEGFRSPLLIVCPMVSLLPHEEENNEHTEHTEYTDLPFQSYKSLSLIPTPPPSNTVKPRFTIQSTNFQCSVSHTNGSTRTCTTVC